MYLPHGGGPSFFLTGERKRPYRPTEDFLRSIRGMLPATPKAILIATAHWEAAVPSLTAGDNQS
jgi:aromatic ring-opening dioxygenase catalytic subunit (LigB family)